MEGRKDLLPGCQLIRDCIECIDADVLCSDSVRRRRKEQGVISGLAVGPGECIGALIVALEAICVQEQEVNANFVRTGLFDCSACEECQSAASGT
jgi:hypothetical protein